MSGATHARVKELFLAALERPPAERLAFLAEATPSEPELQRRVEALLAYHLQSSHPGEPPAESAPRFQSGEIFASRYRMVRALGSGGMGEVWQADDLRLGTPVALKLLRTPSVDRRTALLNEVRLARTVTHPNVCRVFDIGECGNELFLSMEFVDGEDLGSILRRAGPLTLERTLEVGRQLCDALGAAHDGGVLHRDLKPANILVDAGGRVRIADFGIAVAREAVVVERAGTPGYMAPEQLMASGPVSPATDVWALGLVIAEMLTGRANATAEGTDSEYDPRTATARCLESSRIPERLQPIVSQCLTVDPARRLSDVRVLGEALARLQRAPHEDVAARSVLVLPFVNLSDDPANEYFSDGLTEDVIAELSTVDALRVISRRTSMRFKGGGTDLRGLGSALTVRYVLEGNIRKAGDTVKISAQLADIQVDRVLWSERYRGTLDQVFEIQEQVSRAIVGALRLRLTTDEDRRLSRRRQTTGSAYDLYLRTRRDILSFDPERIQRARAELEAARVLADDDVLIVSGLGAAYWQLVNASVATDDSLLEKADACARTLRALDPTGPHGPRLLAYLAAPRGNIRDWMRYGQQALRAAPRDPDSLVWLAMGWTWAGHPDQARPLFERLEVIDPQYDYLHFGLALLDQTAGQFESALRHVRRARQLEPAMPGWPFTEIQLLLQLGRHNQATALAGVLLPDVGVNPLADMVRALVLAVTGEDAGARTLLTPTLLQPLWRDLQYSYFVAQTYAALGDADAGLRWLDQSTRRGFVHHSYLAVVDPLLKPLRDEAGFGELMERVEREWKAIGTLASE